MNSSALRVVADNQPSSLDDVEAALKRAKADARVHVSQAMQQLEALSATLIRLGACTDAFPLKLREALSQASSACNSSAGAIAQQLKVS